MNNAAAKNKTQITIGLDLGYPALPDNQDKTGRGIEWEERDVAQKAPPMTSHATRGYPSTHLPITQRVFRFSLVADDEP